MKRIGVSLFGAMFLAVCAVFVWSLHEAGAEDCPSVDSAGWRIAPAADTADEAGDFDTASLPGTTAGLQLNWAFRETPFMGGAEIIADECQDILLNSVHYTPTWFYTSSCIGSQGIDVSGTLAEGEGNGTLKTLGWIWDSGDPPPYAEDTHTMTVYRS